MIKKFLKKFVPSKLIHLMRKFRYSKSNSKFIDKDATDVFNSIYQSNHWNSEESISGTGSELVQTQKIINDINLLVDKNQIKSILDLPCGDFCWMKNIDFSNIRYLGADIVDKLINKNNEKYSKENISFKVINMIDDDFDSYDLIITRDCLVHLSYKDIFSSLKNIKKSKSKYFLSTTFHERNSNYDIVTGDWRAINLMKPPFNFPKPLLVINEDCSEADGEFKDKSLGLWEISKITIND